MTDARIAEAWLRAGGMVAEQESLPRHFGDCHAEYRCLTQAAGLAWPCDDHVEILGKDRAKFLHNFCTNEIVHQPTGQGCEAFFLTAKGKVFDYGRIYSLSQSLWIEIERGRGAGMVQHLDRFLFREDVRLFDRSATHSSLHLGGPQAATVLQALSDTHLELPQERHVAETVLLGVECQIRGRARSTQGGYDIVATTAGALTLWTGILAAGEKQGLQPVGEDAMEIARVEASLPRFGREITSENLPQEIGRDSLTISYTKGCYIGQETVARLDAYGHVNRMLRGLIVEDQGTVESGQSVTRDGKPLGVVASVVESPRFQAIIALAVLRTTGGEPGSTVSVETPAGPVSAKVAELPFARTGETVH